ncbi:MAG: SidJ-related pseudokinase [Desulfovibrio sp.]|uniref:SidJ-related pseudokinase n=1 Tax=Desulfovibrio sp. 7SRBS1 TaxID=3378064 RepID=UPI003B410825
MNGRAELYDRVFKPPDGRFTVTGLDFTVTYLRVRELAREAGPDSDHPEKYVAAFARVLETAEHDRQKNARYVYREAAQGLCVFLHPDASEKISRLALKTLLRSCFGGTVGVRLAVARVLGELDMGLPECTDCRPYPLSPLAQCSLSELIARHQGNADNSEWLGRTLMVAHNWKPDELLAFKFLRAGESVDCLRREAAWMERLHAMSDSFSGTMGIPVPLDIVRVLPGTTGKALHPEGWVLCYAAGKNYFSYPNDESPGRLPGPSEFLEIMGRNARHMGRLMSLGLTHTAPIPLFHNRVQQGRRRDAGAYQWHRLGRLDQWLASCRHPNFGASGLRDFEHIEPHRGQGISLYHAMGTAMLSLLLVSGSYFRAKNPRLVGQNDDGSPVDARHLFDADLLQKAIKAIHQGFYKGFTQHDIPFPSGFDLPGLCSRMIDEMGVDRHMAEELRVDDQMEMTDLEFADFLTSRGFSRKQIDAMQRGEEDVTILTGPHLGGFNRPISLPELVEFTASSVGLACAGRYAAVNIPDVMTELDRVWKESTSERTLRAASKD